MTPVDRPLTDAEEKALRRYAEYEEKQKARLMTDSETLAWMEERARNGYRFEIEGDYSEEYNEHYYDIRMYAGERWGWTEGNGGSLAGAVVDLTDNLKEKDRRTRMDKK